MFKMLCLFSTLFMAFSAVWAQEEEENSFILICQGNQSEFSMLELENCNQVSIRENDFPVKSFVVMIMKKGKGDENPVEGEFFSPDILEKLKKQKAPRLVRVTGIVDTNDTEVEGFREITITD